MKKKLIYFFLFSFLLGYSQSSLIDESLVKCEKLNQKIEKEPNESVWIKDNLLLEKISKKLLFDPSVSGINKKETFKFFSIALSNKGAYLTLMGKFEESIVFYKQSFGYAKKIKYYQGCSTSLQNIGTSFDYLGKADSCLVYFKKALSFANLSKDKSTIAYVLTDLGYVNNNLGNNKSAIEYNLKALKLFTELKDDEGLERTNFAIGRVFDNLKEYDKSLGYYTKAFQISRKTNNQQRQCLNLNSLANIYFIQKKYNKAKALLKQSVSICNKNNYSPILGVCNNLLGEIAFENKNLKEAKNYFLLANSIFKSDSNDFFYGKSLLKLAEISLSQNNLSEAEDYALASYSLSLKNNYPAEIRAISNVLTKIYSIQKKHKEALKFNLIAYKISDSIYFDESKNIALKSEFKYETEKKEAKIKLLAQQKKIATLESEKQKTIVLILGFALISLVITSYFLFNRYKIKQQNELLKTQLIEAEKTIEAEKKATESELKALKSQMNPHFIFNALSSIQDQFMFGDKVIANEQMGNFTYLTRQILTVSGKKQILIATEIDILTKYLELEKMRFKTDFVYKISTSETIDEDYHEIPPMLIQPFVENSIKHGLLHKSGIKKVEVNFELDSNEEYIICSIIDNGIGCDISAEINAKNQNKHQSFSTESIKQRLELLNENLKLNNLITFSDVIQNELVNGTKVVIKIPIV